MNCFCLRQTAITLCVLAMLIIPGSALCDSAKKEEKPANAAMVNGKAITYMDFERQLDGYKRHAQGQEATGDAQSEDKMRKEVMDNMIGRELIYQKAVAQGITATDEQVMQEMTSIKRRFTDQEQYKTMLARMNTTEESLKDQISRMLVVRDFIGKEIVPKVNVSDKELETFYKENAERFKMPEQVQAQHILIKLEKDATDEQKAEARKKLTELKKQIDAGADFGELAKANSQCPSAPRGGDLGYFGKGRMVPEFEKAAFALKPGEVSGIVETQFGYHLIKVLDHKPAGVADFQEVKTRLMAEVRNDKIQAAAEAYAAELRKNAKIEIFIK